MCSMGSGGVGQAHVQYGLNKCYTGIRDVYKLIILLLFLPRAVCLGH